jgi:predicted small metal-binding protein
MKIIKCQDTGFHCGWISYGENNNDVVMEEYQHLRENHGVSRSFHRMQPELHSLIRNYESPSGEGITAASAPRNDEELMGVGRAGAPEINLPGEMSRASVSRIRESGASAIRVSQPGFSRS